MAPEEGQNSSRESSGETSKRKSGRRVPLVPIQPAHTRLEIAKFRRSKESRIVAGRNAGRFVCQSIRRLRNGTSTTVQCA